MSSELKFVGLCGSLRAASRNMGLLRCAQANLPDNVSLHIADIRDLPLFNEDLQKPASALQLIEAFNAADAVVFACPEYNYSVAPALKNALDWLSREPRLEPLAGKACAIMGAGSQTGTIRAQYHLRQTLVYLDMHPLNKPEIFTNAFSDSFAANGDVQDQQLAARIATMLQTLADWTKKLKSV